MKRSCFLFFVSCFLLPASSVWAQPQLQVVEPQNYIEVNARAYREVSPDEIFLSITLDQNDSKGKYSLDELERQLYRAVKAAGVDADKFLKVSDISSDLQRFFLKKSDGRATKQYQLQLSNEQLMPVFQQLDKAGISHIELQSARYSKRTEVYNELLGEAVALAKKRAEIMAEAGNTQALRMIYAQTYDNSPSYQMPMARAMGNMILQEASMDMAAPTLEFERMRIEVNVTARFGLLGN